MKLLSTLSVWEGLVYYSPPLSKIKFVLNENLRVDNRDGEDER